MDCAAAHEVKFLKRKFLNLAGANVYRDKILHAFSKVDESGAVAIAFRRYFRAPR